MRYVDVKYVAAVLEFERSVAVIDVPLVAEELEAYHQPSVFSNVTFESEVHILNASSPILVTLLGITIDFSDVHSRKARPPILVTELPIVTLVSEVQPMNA